MSLAYLMLGSNSGKRDFYISEAIKFIKQDVGDIVLSSSLYETEPWGFETPDIFLNQAIIVKSRLDPFQILKNIQYIEQILFRERRSERYSSRTIDIDILFYDSIVVQTEQLQIPHPLIQERRFVLVPLFEIASDYVHPTLGKTIGKLLEECNDMKTVRKL